MRKIKLFSLLAVLLVTCFTSTAWAWSGSGTENDPYLISSVTDWNTLSTNSQSNTYAGVYFRLMNDLSVGTMIGSESDEAGRFAGIFDGNGHTLTVSYDVTENHAAPFRNVNNVTIKNLIVEGSIKTNQKYAAGIIGRVRGTTSIENCRVSVQITDNTNGDGTDGGFVGVNYNGALTITGCVFDGIINSPGVRGWGGFVGWTESNNSATTVITNCLFAPASASFTATDCQTFSRYRNSASVTLTNCYYALALAGTQGTQVYSPKAMYGATIEMAGTPTTTYNVSQLYMYSTGLASGSKLYALSNTTLSVNLSGSDAGYVVRPNTGATLSGSSNPYSLQIGSQNTQIAPNIPNATVDGTGYVFFEDAVNAWGNNQTLQLLADMTISNRISIENTRICDLNGHGIIQEGDYEIFEVKNGGNLTLIDSNTGNLTHKFAIDANGVASLDEENGTVVVNGGFITGGKGNNLENGGIAKQGRNGGAIFVYNNSTLTMNGGTIIGNIAARHAGGVFVCKNSLFTFNGGTITRNQGRYAGGVDIYCSTKDIDDNVSSTMRMNGGTISYNYSTEHTGGIAINSDNGAITVEITGGSIVNNHSADNRAAGVYVEHTNTNLRISGNPVIKDNYSDNNPTVQQNILLNNGKITIIGALTNTEKIGVTMTTPGEFTTDLSAYGNASNFSSDDPTYGVIINSNNEAQLAIPATLSDAPTAISNLEYDGNAQALVNAGTAVNGMMAYSLDGTNWSATIPTGTDAGTYTVYYMVQGDATHADYIPANNTIEVTIAEAAPTPSGDKLPGAFTVDGGKVVYFSKGNLQATTNDLGATWTWGFAKHQYDYIGNAAANNAINGNGTVSTNGTVDLFGWSTSSTVYGIHNSTDNGTYYASFVDWSSNPDLKASLGEDWRTLTSSEWGYLLDWRTTTSGVRYAKATVNSVAGLIILPDNWDEAYHALASTNNLDVDFDDNIISSADWKNELEAHGAVFLPAAGNRSGTNVSEAGSAGYYWSATSVDAYTANYMYFNNSELSANSFNLLIYGRSVRLVSETAPAPATVNVATNADPLSPSMHYSTFFHSTQNYALTGDGTQAFIAKINGGDFVLTKIADGTQVIPANTAVIFCKSGSSDPIVLSPTDEAGVSVNPDNNSLCGVDEATALSSLSIDQNNCYVLSGTAEHGVGFYKINTTTLLAHKAYYAHVAAGAPPRRIRFVYSEANEATGMENVQGDNVQSTKVLEDGVIYIERNGVRYNAQGQIVK